MKQLARSAVYWPKMDQDINDVCRHCTACAEYQNKPEKPANHPWIIPEKPWSRLHIDHAINFMGYNWLVITDAYSKYPCIHPTTSTSTKSTTFLLEEDFSHFGYPHTIVSDNSPTFTSQEFQDWCKERGIIHLTGAPYHPATNGAAKRLVQTFKQVLRKSDLPPKEALQEFLMQYRRTPLSSGFSPSELLNGRQIRTKIDTLLPSPAHMAQKQQAHNTPNTSQSDKTKFKVGDNCYALYCGPKATEDPRWIPGTITKVRGTRNFEVRVQPHGTVWRRHLEQLKPRYTELDTDTEPPMDIAVQPSPQNPAEESIITPSDNQPQHDTTINHTPEYGAHNPRRSKRPHKPRKPYDV
jgi:hypothetical protein